MKTIIPFLAIGFSLALFACAKKKPPEVEVQAPLAEEAPAPVEASPVSTGPSQEDALEAERKKLEDMINKIMSDDVYFEFDQATLTAAAKDLLSQVGDILKKETRFTVLTEGHTDERGTENYNLGLGMRRAESVVKFLTDYGVSADRLSKVSMGQEQPKVEGTTEEAYAQNRRAAFKVQVK